MDIKLYKDYYNVGYDLYKTDKLSLLPGLTVLVGCNGSGKSTLLHQLRDKLEEKEIPFLSYDNLKDGQNNAMQHALNVSGDINLLATLATSSEGEQISINFRKFVRDVGAFVKKNSPSNKEVFVLLDAIDSGLSIDQVQEFKSFFQFAIDTEKKNGTDLYFIASSNEYELCENSQCLTFPDIAYRTFTDYEDYRQCIIASREYKDNRIKSISRKTNRPELDPVFEREI